MTPDSLPRDRLSGFEGSIAGLPLTDVIQLKGHNRFSGCIVIEYQQRQGMIFFRDGEIIHAEQEGKTGELALFEILRWPGGRFTIQSKVTTTSRSIQQSIGFLLLEAHRLMDEDRAGGGHFTESSDATVTVRRRMSPVAERLLQITGVSYAVLMKPDGTPIEDDSFEAEALAGKGVVLASLGARLGSLLGLGGIRSAAVHAKSSQILLFEAKSHFISLAIRGESSLSQVEADIRAAFAAKK